MSRGASPAARSSPTASRPWPSGVSFVSHLGHGLSFHHSIVAGLLLAYLWIYRRRFQARADPQSARQALLMAPVLGALVLVYGFIGLRSLEAQFEWDAGNTPLLEAARSGLVIDDAGVDPTTPLAARFLGSLEIAGWLARAYLLVMLLRPVIARTRLEAPAEAVERAFRSWARCSLASFAVEGDKHHLLVAGGRGLVAYAVRGRGGAGRRRSALLRRGAAGERARLPRALPQQRLDPVHLRSLRGGAARLPGPRASRLQDGRGGGDRPALLQSGRRQARHPAGHGEQGREAGPHGGGLRPGRRDPTL